MKVVEKHAVWLRWVHWLNVPFLGLMVWSGILIYWANDIYPGFFPEWFYRFFHIDHKLAFGMAVHFTMAWFFIINGLFYLIELFLSGHWRELFPNRQTIQDFVPTVLQDLGLRRQSIPQGKFNAAQKIAYTGIIVVGLFEVLTGFSIYKPVQLQALTNFFGGYEWARFFHFLGMLAFVFFFLLHVLQVVRAGWNNFRSMVAGFEVKNES